MEKEGVLAPRAARRHGHVQLPGMAGEWEHGITSVSGYDGTRMRDILWWTLVVLTCGIAALVTSWRPDWELHIRRKPCSLRSCTHVLVAHDDGNLFVETIHIEQVNI
jgi:hypothetical protein